MSSKIASLAFYGLFLALISSQILQADDPVKYYSDWRGKDGIWNGDATKWSLGLPDSNVPARINNGDTVTIDNYKAETREINIGDQVGMSGKLVLKSGSLNSFSFRIGGNDKYTGGGSGSFEIVNGKWEVEGQSTVGNLGVGDVTMSGGIANLNGGFWVGYTGVDHEGKVYKGKGTYLLSGGSLNTKNGAYIGQNYSKDLKSGENAEATFTITGGSWTNTEGDTHIGQKGATGKLEISGGQFKNSGALNIGEEQGVGMLDVSSNGQLQNDNIVNVGTGKGGIGTVKLSGGTSVIGKDLNIGVNGGTGTVEITGGTFQNDGIVNVGAGGTGTVKLSGGASTIYKDLNIGVSGGTGTVEITGGTFKIQGAVNIGKGANSTGSLTLSNVKIDIPQVTIGDASGAKGTLTLGEKGVLSTESIQAANSANQKLLFNGGTLQATKDNNNFTKGFSEGGVSLQDKGGTIDTNGKTLGIISNIGGAGSLTVDGGGRLAFNANQSYTGATFVNKETTLIVNSELATEQVIVSDKGILTGSGIVDHNVVIRSGGRMSPGSDAQHLTFNINGDYTQEAGGTLEIPIYPKKQEELQYEMLHIKGVAKLDGVATFNLIAGFIPGDGMAFTFLHADKGRRGFFSNVPLFPTELRMDFEYLPDGVIGHLVHVGFEGAGKTVTERSVARALDVLISQGSSPKVNKSTEVDVSTSAANEPSGIYINDEDAKRAGAGHGAGELGQYIWNLETVPYDKISPYLAQLIPTQEASIKDIMFNAANMQYGQITDRLAAIRGGAVGFSLNGINAPSMEQQVSTHEANLRDRDGKTVMYRSAGSEETSPWSLFATASGIFSNMATPHDLPNQHVMTGYFNTGMDCRFNEHFNGGLYIGYQGIESRYTGSVLRSNGLKFGAYGTGHWNGFYVNAMVGGGFSDYYINRTMSIANDSWVAKSEPSSGELDSLVGGGYEFNLGHWKFGTNVSIQYTYLGISSFSEVGAGTLDVHGAGQNPSSLVSTLGANISYQWEIAPGYRITPMVGLSWQREYLNHGQNISAAFDNGNGPAFTFSSMDGDQNNAFGTAGINMELAHHFGLYCYYTPQFGGKQITSHGVLAGLNYNF